MPHLWKSASVACTRLLAASLRRLAPGEVESLARHLFLRADLQADGRLEVFVRTAAALYGTSINDLDVNGERWLLERTAPLGFTTLFDVGANAGEWTRCALRCHPRATVHAFEIVPATFAAFTRNVADCANVVANAFGLSDTEGNVEVFISDSSLVSSQYDFSAGGPTTSISCKVERGADYTRRRGIAEIDLIKIDVEGADGAVVRGFEPLIAAQAVRAVQFEYNKGAIESHFLLVDFYRLFRAHGYVLGRLTPRGVAFRDYDYAFEDFNGPNYLACRASDRELIDLVTLRG